MLEISALCVLNSLRRRAVKLIGRWNRPTLCNRLVERSDTFGMRTSLSGSDLEEVEYYLYNVRAYLKYIVFRHLRYLYNKILRFNALYAETRGAF